MSPWIALFVPIVGAAIMLLFFSRKVLWWELLIPIAATALVIFVCKLCVTAGLQHATESRGSLIVKARYYEYWDTYVHKTCSYTVSCGKNCTRTVYYDCSYCDENPAKWEATDGYGNTYAISQDKYNRLQQQWHAGPTFVNMHRDIDYSGGCGKDGNAYDIVWNNDPATADAAVFEHDYTNRPQAAKSAFHYPTITKKAAVKLGLWDYPAHFDYYRQSPILGLEAIVAPNQIERIQRKFEYFDGYYGQHKHIKLFVLLFYDKPQSIALQQEAYWAGGNDNELVVCIGLNKASGELQWTKAFSWCFDKRPVVDCREDIMADKTFNADSVYNAIERTVVQNFKPRNLDSDFSYLQADIPMWAIILTFILALGVTLGTSWWAVTNEYEYDN